MTEKREEPITPRPLRKTLRSLELEETTIKKKPVLFAEDGHN
jgi:hypothetical protein